METLVDKEDLNFSPPQLGCVLWLSGLPGGDSKIHDRSPYGNIGVITGASWIRIPSGLWCLSFDGSDDYLNCGSDNSLASYGKGKITWEFWIYPKSDGEGGNGRIADKSNGYNFRVESELSNAVKLEGFVSHATTGADAITTNRIAINTWHHVVFVYNEGGAKKIKIYADGALMPLTTDVAGVGVLSDDTANALYIGNESGATKTFDGYIALPRILNRALSAFEIQNQFDCEKRLFGVWQA